MSRTEQFQQLVARQPDNELFRFSLAQALAAEGRFDEAVPHFRQCVAKRGDWMIPRIILGKILLQMNHREEAKLLLGDALRLAVEQHHEDPERELRTILAEL